MRLPGSWCLHGASSGLLPRGCPAPLCPAEVSASPLSTWACAIWPQSGGPRFCLHLKGLVRARPAWPSRLAKLPPHVPVLPVTLPSGPAWGPSKALPWCLPAPGTNCLSLSDRSAAGCSQQPLARHLWWAGEAGCHAQRGLRRVASPCLGRETRGAMRHPQWRGGSEEAAAHHGPLCRAWQSCGVHPISCVKAPDTADSEAPAPSSAALPPAQPWPRGCPRGSQRLPHGRPPAPPVPGPEGCGEGRSRESSLRPHRCAHGLRRRPRIRTQGVWAEEHPSGDPLGLGLRVGAGEGEPSRARAAWVPWTPRLPERHVDTWFQDSQTGRAPLQIWGAEAVLGSSLS